MGWLVPISLLPMYLLAELSYSQFYAFYKEDTELKPAKNTLALMRTKRSTRELFLEMRYKDWYAVNPPDISILAHEEGTPFEFEDLNVYETASADTKSDHVPHPLDGYWSMTCRDANGDYPTLGLFHFILSVAPDGSITGSGELYTAKLKLTGTFTAHGDGLPITMDLRMIGDVDNDYIFHGTYNQERDIVTGSWEKADRSVDSADPEAEEDGANEDIQDNKPADDPTAASDVNGNPTDASNSSQANNEIDDPNAQQSNTTSLETEEVAVDSAPTEHEDTEVLAQADTPIEDAHTSRETMKDPDQQPSPSDESTHDHIGPAVQDDLPPGVAADNEGSEDSDSSASEPVQDTQSSDDMIKVAENAQGDDDAVVIEGETGVVLSDQPDKTINSPEGSNDMTSEESKDSDTPELAAEPEVLGDVAENEDLEGADDPMDQVDESPASLDTFAMRRTPAHLHRFRRNINLDTDTDTDSSLLAKNRWKFAIAAIKFQVQKQSMSWEYVRTCFAERRLWLDLAVAFWLDLLPPNRVDFMCTLTMDYPPSQSRLYETIASFLNDRAYPYKT